MDARIEMSHTVADGGLRLFRQLLRHDGPDAQVFCSPLSVISALTLALLGARPGSKTYRGLCTVLTGKDTVDENALVAFIQTMLRRSSECDVELCVANSAWLTSCISENFRLALKQKLNAQIFELTTVEEINAWVLSNTRGMITKIIEDISPSTPAVLVNAVFFMGRWLHPFDVKDTIDSKFFGFDDTSKPCKMMRQKIQKVACARTGDATIAAVPYGAKGVFAVLALPHRSGTQALNELVDNVDANWLKHAVSLSSATLNLHMPRFRLEYGAKLQRALSELGAGAMFDVEHGNGFLPMNDCATSEIYVQDVIHKSACVVNEQGTKAAAATAVSYGIVSCIMREPECVEMRLDRPFLFIIYDSCLGQPLFLGRITQPIFNDVANT